VRTRNGPSWWVKVPLYAATWPGKDCAEWRISLQRQYLKAERNGGRKVAMQVARREAWGYTKAAAMRSIWWLEKAIRVWWVAKIIRAWWASL
jgi:hypothetical protein